jgi:hypothetical protein
MDNYTMTFKYDGDFDLPDDPGKRDAELPGMVLKKLESHEFELVDFNLSENYDNNTAERYIDDPHLHRAVLEIRLDLAISSLKNREAIYARCLKAMQENKLSLGLAYENDNKKLGMLQSIIVFEMKNRVDAAL